MILFKKKKTFVCPTALHLMHLNYTLRNLALCFSLIFQLKSSHSVINLSKFLTTRLFLSRWAQTLTPKCWLHLLESDSEGKRGGKDPRALPGSPHCLHVRINFPFNFSPFPNNFGYAIRSNVCFLFFYFRNWSLNWICHFAIFISFFKCFSRFCFVIVFFLLLGPPVCLWENAASESGKLKLYLANASALLPLASTTLLDYAEVILHLVCVYAIVYTQFYLKLG